MFGKKQCKKCNSKINKDFDFCPYCGNRKENPTNWGMLGKNDSINEDAILGNSMFGGLGGGMLNNMIGSAMKMLENEMQKEMKQTNIQNQPKTDFQLFINGKKVNVRRINQQQPQLQQLQNQRQNKPKQVKILPFLSDKKLKKVSKLEKIEPATTVRRFSNKVIYEIKIPGVKSIKDISIIKLENSIEVKALGKNKAYFKTIKVNLDILNFSLNEGELILELEAK